MIQRNRQDIYALASFSIIGISVMQAEQSAQSAGRANAPQCPEEFCAH